MARRKKIKLHFTRRMQIKLLAVFAFVLLALVGLNLRIAYITATDGNQYAKQVLSQKEYDSRTIPYKRGEIQDANGIVLAKSEKVYNLILDCYAVNLNEDYEDPTVEALVKCFGLDETEVRGLLSDDDTKDSQYQIIKKEVTLDDKNAFEEYTNVDSDTEYTKTDLARRLDVQGVWFEEDFIRTYTQPTLASNVIGFSNDENSGVCGLEAYYNDILNGTNGREFGYLDENSDLQRTIIDPDNGNTIVSTIDANIQQIVQKYIDEFDAEYGGGGNESANGQGSKNTGVVLMDPNTGEILAMASNHGFDLTKPFDLSGSYTEAEEKAMSEEELSEALNTKWSNYCVSDAYEPGSVFKPVTIASALECGAITQDSEYYCDGGEFITDTQINCDNIYGHGQETLTDVIKNSCNDGLMQIGYKLGVKNFCKYHRLFNFGSMTGIDVPNENAGVLYNEDAMHEVELATNTFGQTFTCSMIQEITAISSVVNGGYYYRPHLVKQILNEKGGVVKNIEPELENQLISSDNSRFVLSAMETAVKEGTGKKAQVPGYRIAGKTGTAEKQPRGMGNYLVSFIGAAPADKPQLVIYVVVDEPNVAAQESGGYAMIIARKIMTEVLPYMNIPQTEEITDEVLTNLGLTWDDVSGGRNAILENEKAQTQTTETDEYGNTVTAETDEYGNTVTAETDENGNAVTPETDENGNEITAETEPAAAENPNIPNPPTDNGENTDTSGQNSVTAEELGIDSMLQ